MWVEWTRAMPWLAGPISLVSRQSLRVDQIDQFIGVLCIERPTTRPDYQTHTSSVWRGRVDCQDMRMIVGRRHGWLIGRLSLTFCVLLANLPWHKNKKLFCVGIQMLHVCHIKYSAVIWKIIVVELCTRCRTPMLTSESSRVENNRIFWRIRGFPAFYDRMFRPVDFFF